MTDRTERATTRAAEASDAEMATLPVETRQRDPGESAPLYAVATRKVSGEWRTFDTFTCPRIANQVAAILKSFGAETRIELIEQPIP